MTKQQVKSTTRRKRATSDKALLDLQAAADKARASFGNQTAIDLYTRAIGRIDAGTPRGRDAEKVTVSPSHCVAASHPSLPPSSALRSEDLRLGKGRGSSVTRHLSLVTLHALLAARLESHTKVVGRPILIDDNTRAGLSPEFSIEDQGSVELKGKTQAVHVFSVTLRGAQSV